jgi:hypothetical protein
MAVLSPRLKAILYTSGAIIVIAALTAGIWWYMQPRYNLAAAYITEPPKIDGRLNDAVWTKSETLSLPIKDGLEIDIKALYTNDMINISARFPDTSRDAVERVWTFDGKGWTTGRAADGFELFFVKDESIPAFKKKGFDFLTYGLGKNSQIYNLGLVQSKKNAADWPGVNGQADLWVAYPNTVLPIDDMFFGAEAHNLNNPTGNISRLFTRWDESQATGLTKLNVNVWQQAINVSEGDPGAQLTQEEPYLAYKDATKTVANTPYPFDYQLAPIGANDIFEKGDTLPFIYFTKEAEKGWGGSRGDITGRMIWQNGWWTVELARKLDTGNSDDIAFKPADDKAVDFGALARLDGKNVVATPPARLTFIPKGGG